MYLVESLSLLEVCCSDFLCCTTVIMSTEEEAISRENCECTQLNINESSRDTYSSQNQEEEPEEIESNVWGLLRRKGGNREEYKLVYRIHDGQQDRYSIGRSRAADVLFEHRRASSIHCLIYCDYSEARLRVFIEDCSSNGTFVNNSLTRLRKGERIELKSGDEIYLVNPRYMKPEDEIAAFVFINMRERLVSQRKIVVAPDSQQVFCGNFHAEHIENYYIIGDQIGSGVCGQVHFCVHRETQQQCAVKIIDTRKFVMTGGLSIDDLKEEAEMMQQLDHPNIIKVLDTYQSAYAVFIVMELLRGGDLFDRIVERGKYTEDTARKLMVNLLSAVEYLHSKNIIHRDLKPENILLVDSYNDVDVKLTDFGLAKKANQEGLKTFCGTPQYFAPEVLSRKTSENGIGRYGAAADVWSLGVVLYILLSGTFPFAEEHLFDQVSQLIFKSLRFFLTIVILFLASIRYPVLTTRSVVMNGREYL